jgi:hypothetical protein
MAAWDELKVVLARLRDEQPGVLMQYPMPEVDEGRQPPFGIHLAPGPSPLLNNCTSSSGPTWT